MLTMAVLLAISSAIFEISLGKAVPIYHKLSCKSSLFNLVGSMILSYVLGLMFGATGLIAFMAGVISTVITIPYYKISGWLADNKQQVAQVKQTFRDTANMCYKVLRVFTAPIRFIRWVSGVRA